MLCSWSRDSALIVAPAKAPSSVLASAETPSSFPTILKQDFGYDNASVRKLLDESHGIFMRFLNFVKNLPAGRNLVDLDVLQKTSTEFRISIRACCIALEKEINGNQEQKLENLLQFYRRIEVIWHLCDVLFFRPQGSFLLKDLLEWSRWNFTEPDDAVKEILQGTNSGGGAHLENHEKYWKTIYGFLLTGRLAETQQLLNAHSKRNTDAAFQSVDDLLSGYPLSELALNDGRLQFFAWQEEVKRRLQSGRFVAFPELETMAKILMGDENTFKTLHSICSTWYQPIVGMALFTQPFAKIFDLQHLAEECFKLTLSPNTAIASMDKIILALFEIDILTAVKELCLFPNWWCAAHLSALLWYGGCSELFSVKHHIDLREHLLFEYGESLMASDGNMWQIGADYLAACPTYGISALRLWLERIPVDAKDFHKAFKVVEIFRKYNLYEAATSFCKEKAVGLLKAGNLSNALTWCLQANDSQFATYMADQLLRMHCRSSCLHDLEMLSSVGDIAAMLSPLLAFVCKYRQANMSALNGEHKVAASLLTDLIASKIAPREFWMNLFRDVVEILHVSGKDVVFNADQTYKILDALQVMVLEVKEVKNMNYFVDNEGKSSFDQDVKAFRMALVKNLSNALLQIREKA